MIDVPVERLLGAPRSEHPCMTCSTSPCCTNVPLQTFRVRRADDLDYAAFLINFDGIEIGLSPAGPIDGWDYEWGVRYRAACRHLDRSDPGNWLCSVHGTPTQPQVCVDYDATICWYKRVMGAEAPPVSGEFLRVDRRRFEVLRAHARWDGGELRSLPDWSALMALWGELPVDESLERPAPATPPCSSAPAPCGGCAAYCCTTLQFPLRTPETAKRIDYTRFLLGYPNVEAGEHAGEWTLLVRTSCRHLTEDGRCAVYGRPERPRICADFRVDDARDCSYVARLGPTGMRRVNYEQFR